jgi:hypothetical protein
MNDEISKSEQTSKPKGHLPARALVAYTSRHLTRAFFLVFVSLAPSALRDARCAAPDPNPLASPHLAEIGSCSTIELQRTVNRLLNPCLTQGDNPTKTSYAESI